MHFRIISKLEQIKSSGMSAVMDYHMITELVCKG